MRIDDLLSAEQTERSAGIIKHREQEETPFLPPSWAKGDTVSFSTEARAMQQLSTPDTPQNSAENDRSGDEAADKLSEAIKKASGAVSTTDSASQIEALQKKVKELQAKLAQVAGSSMPDEAKESMMAGLNAQISQLTTQIAELQTEAAKQGQA